MLQRGRSRPEPERKVAAPEVREIMPAALAEEVLKRTCTAACIRPWVTCRRPSSKCSGAPPSRQR